MKRFLFFLLALVPVCLPAHTVSSDGAPFDKEALRQHILGEFQSRKATAAKTTHAAPLVPLALQKPALLASAAPSFNFAAMFSGISATSAATPAGNGALMAASFAPFKPRVRYYWDGATFYEESDNAPDPAMMPTPMVGITSWQQQIPVPTAYFASTTNPEGSTSSLGYGQPNYWRLPLVPAPSASPIPISAGNFQRGAVALAANGIAIFNPKNNTGRVSYEIGELDAYGGHCGLADDYHYHIIPTHLLSAFGGVLSNDKPVAWALDGYPIYGYVEPDGTARQTLDADGGHDIGNGWGYHYHAIGTTTVDASHPYGTPQTPYLMNNFHGTVVNFGGQVDGQPEVSPIRASGTGGYTAQPVSGASIVAFKNPVSLTTDGSGNLIENVGGTTSSDSYLMRVNISGTNYDECWKINRNVNPKTLTVTWRLSGATTTTTYTPTAGTAAGNRLTAYPMAGWSEVKLPDTGETLDATATFGEDSDYTINPPSFTDNGNGTVTDNVTGLMWQKTDNGESTWETAVANAPTLSVGGYTDWRLPTPAELLSIMNHNNNPALNTTYFPSNASGAPDYWWSSDVFGSSTTNVWCTNSGGGVGPKPKTETISAGGSLRYAARYVRGARPTNGHNYANNNDGTVTDLDTGLMWTQLPAASMNWNSALSYAENLSLSGYSDWRLPNVKELQTLVDYTLATSTSTTNNLPCINRTMFTKTLTNCTTNSGSAIVTCDSTTGLIAGMPLAARSSITGAYIPSYVTVGSVTDATHFVMSTTATGTGSGLILTAMVPPTAYWTSSSVKAGSLTQAWLVETGVNNSVPAGSGPTRNAQGIISYEIYASTYPVFAVRTTTVTTQIAVSQNGSSLTDGVSNVSYGNVNVGSTLTRTFTINNTGATSLSITGVTIDGTAASNFTVTASPASTIAAGGSTTMDVKFNASTAGNKVAALHIASSDTAVGAAFDITLSGTGYVPPPTVTSVATNPTVPSNTDTPYVTASVTPSTGATISSVQLTYSSGAQTTGTAFQEIFANASTTSGITGAMNAWTSTSVRAPGDVKLRGGTGNHTPAVVLTACATTSGSTTVTCASTTGLVAGMSISGTNIASTAAISSVTNSTTFVISTAATGTSTGLSLTAAGISLTGCSLTTSPTIQCASTTGLVVGMGIAGTGLTTNPPSPTILAITDATHFTVNSTVTAVPATLTATGCGLEFSNGTTTSTDTMAATTNAINAGSATAGYVEFYVQNANLISNNGWTFQISPDGGTTWNTRLSENYAGSTVSLTGCAVTSGSTSVTCASTTGLAAGMTVQGTSSVTLSACGTTNGSATVTCANTTGLIAGMYVNGSGIPNGTHVLSVTTNTSFTLSANASGTASVSVLANILNANTTISSVTNSTTFVLNAAPFYTGTGLALDATTINHGFTLKHYDLVAADMKTNMMMRFQWNGYNGLAPAKPPACDIDDIMVILTTGAPPVTVTMYDDGLHGDGAAGDGVYGVQLPAFASGSTISYSVTATDSNSSVTTLASAGTFTTGAAPGITTASPLNTATLGGSYTQTLAATSGTPGYTWSLSTGSLPAGLSLSSAGVISGSATTAGTSSFTVLVTDSAGRVASKAFALTVSTTTAPNVVIILTDDQGWGDIGYHTYGTNVPVQTPNMDKLGVDGIRLEKFYPTTVCAVTRACLLTGRNSLRTNAGNQKGLGLTEHLMPQTFKAAGYQTYMVGKWHIGGWDNDIYSTTLNGSTVQVIHEGDEYLPFNRGWDFHKGQYGGSINYFTHTSVDPGRTNLLDWWQNGAPVNETTDAEGNGGYSTDLLADKAVNLIQTRDKTKPMLLYLAFNGVHAGVQAPQSYINKYAALGVTDTTRRTLVAAVDCMDVAMGRVLSALDSEGITNNTLVVFGSDNGGDTTTGSVNLPLRGTKSDAYDGGLHTPAAIRWPGHLAAGVTSNQYVWVGDLFPTICAAVGVTPQNSKPFDGVNLWPALQSISSGNPDGAVRSTSIVTGDASGPVAFDTFTDPVNGGSKVFKLLRKPGTPVTNQLFNMTADPYETTDLLLGANASSYTTIVSTLTTDITGIAVENYPPYIGPTGITQTVAPGSTTTLYAPFSSYKAPTVQWRKNGTNIANASPYYNVTSSGVGVNGVYMATLTLTNISSTDAATYDVVITNIGGTTISAAGALTVLTAPVLNALPAFSPGATATVSWPAVTGATTYTVQVAATADFAVPLSMQIVGVTSATFTGLTSGSLYYYRANAAGGSATSAYSNIVSSTQDATSPVIVITSPLTNSTTTHATVVIQGTASDTISGLASVTVNGVAATTSDAFAHWTATIPLGTGANTLTVTATDNAGNAPTAAVTVTRVVSTQNDGLPDAWKLAHGIDPNSNLAINGPLGDIDGDGRCNLLEYAFNTNPKGHEASPVQTSTASGYLELSFPQLIGALDLTYAVEVSDAMASWSSTGANVQTLSTTPNGDGITQTITIRVLPALNAAAKKFARVRITAQ